jgi:serine/threonine protein kinase
VYRAVHLALSKDVAVKVLHSDLLESAEIVERFRQEGVSACRVRHPNAVAVLDAGTSGEGIPYLVMELLEGKSLAHVLSSDGAMRLARCRDVIDPVFDALREAHDSGIIHRDIKPANIMLSVGPAGEEIVKVLDFGIAKLMESQPSSANTLTQGTGTPRYMAPERLLGESSDAKADVYSLGVTLFEMLTGTLPFPRLTGTAVQQAVQQLHATPTPLPLLRPDLPSDFSRMVMSAFAWEKRDRPELAALQAAVDDWAARFVEPEWPVPELAAYLAAQGAAAEAHTSGPGADAPTRLLENAREIRAAQGESGMRMSDLGSLDAESGDHATARSEEPPAVAPPAPKKNGQR